MTKPLLVFIPGMWEGVAVFDPVLHTLRTQHGYQALVLPLISTGTNGYNTKLYNNDVTAIRRRIEELVEVRGQEILLIMHSAGALAGSDAIEDLGLPFRKARGLLGGIRKLVYLIGELMYEDLDYPPAAHFLEYTDGVLRCRDPEQTLFNDFHPTSAVLNAKLLSWQPMTYASTLKVSYCAWREIPSVYLCCTLDQVIPLQVQCQMAAMAGAETESCDAGHMVMLSQPHRVVDFIVRAARSTEG